MVSKLPKKRQCSGSVRDSSLITMLIKEKTSKLTYTPSEGETIALPTDTTAHITRCVKEKEKQKQKQKLHIARLKIPKAVRTASRSARKTSACSTSRPQLLNPTLYL